MTEFTLKDFFYATDNMDSQAFANFFLSDASWFFGNNEPVEGAEAIKGMADNFFETLKGIRHDVHKNIRSANTIFLEGNVSYFRHDNNAVEVPFACSIELVDEKIKIYRTYVDLAPLLAFESRI